MPYGLPTLYATLVPEKEPESPKLPHYTAAEAAAQHSNPPAGHMGPSNTHLLSRHPTVMVACLAPKWVDDLREGMAALLDQLMYT